jgi:serine/threonine-protein kinase ATR
LTFPEPTAWLQARLNYARSAAVMSMVGHIVGLGDRHGENILLDTLTGDLVHIDLNCLFWKGLSFEKPERVPFRLTPQMQDALGVTKYEGVFRKVCEITLRVLRNNRDTLMSVLETLIHDPLVEWAAKDKKSVKTEFFQTINTIENLLQGKIGGLLPISVEGQVHKLLEDATSISNLSRVSPLPANYSTPIL